MDSESIERFTSIEKNVGELSVNIAVLDNKMDNTTKKLDSIDNHMAVQTQILNKFLVLEDRHTNLEANFKKLNEDYSNTKDEVIKVLGGCRGIVFAGGVFVTIIMGLVLYVFQDKVKILDRHTTQIERLISKDVK